MASFHIYFHFQSCFYLHTLYSQIPISLAQRCIKLGVRNFFGYSIIAEVVLILRAL